MVSAFASGSRHVAKTGNFYLPGVCPGRMAFMGAILYFITGKDGLRKKILYPALCPGLLVSFYLTYRLITQPISAGIIGMHISYNLGSMNSALHDSAILYFIATVIPPFVSGVKKMWLFGVIIAVSYVITHLFFKDYELSVWCFFAAVMSIAVFAILFDLQQEILSSMEPREVKPGNTAVSPAGP